MSALQIQCLPNIDHGFTSSGSYSYWRSLATPKSGPAYIYADAETGKLNVTHDRMQIFLRDRIGISLHRTHVEQFVGEL